MIEDILNAYNAAILGREDNFLAFIENKYSKYTFDDKFYYTKTSEVK